MTQTQAEPNGSRLLDILAKFDVSLGRFDKHMDKMDDDRLKQWKLLQSIFPIEIPARSAVVASTNLSIADPEQLGPREGWVWDVHRISVYGLNAATEVCQVFKAPSGATAAQVAQNFVCTLTPGANQTAAKFAATQTFGKGQCVLKAGYSFQIINAAAFTNGETVTFSGDAISIAEPFIGDYFL